MFFKTAELFAFATGNQCHEQTTSEFSNKYHCDLRFSFPCYDADTEFRGNLGCGENGLVSFPQVLFSFRNCYRVDGWYDKTIRLPNYARPRPFCLCRQRKSVAASRKTQTHQRQSDLQNFCFAGEEHHHRAYSLQTVQQRVRHRPGALIRRTVCLIRAVLMEASGS